MSWRADECAVKWDAACDADAQVNTARLRGERHGPSRPERVVSRVLEQLS